MARHRASPVTVQRAITRLAGEGVIDPRPGRGTFVAHHATGTSQTTAPDLSWQSIALGERIPDSGGLAELLAMPPPGVIPLSTGFLEPALQPTAALGTVLARAARRPGAWGKIPIEGIDGLRDWFARQAGGQLVAHDFVVCPGGQAALSTAFRALATPGDAVLVESPTYLGALAAARAAGLRVVPVPTDGDGIRPDLLARAFEHTGARLLIVQPAFANPHGATLAAERRPPVLEAAIAAGAFVIEDDWARDLGIDHDPPPPLVADDPHGHVVYLRSLTKPAAPGLRVAGVAARGAAGVRLRTARVIDDFFVSGPLQEAALDLVTSPAWRRHRVALRAGLAERRDALLDALARHLPACEVVTVPAGGLHLWLRLPDGTDDVALAAAAPSAGVIVSAGRPWFPAEPPAPHLRLTFAGAGPAELAEGVRRLSQIMRR